MAKEDENQNTAEAKPSGKKKLFIIIGAVVLLLVVGGGGAFFFSGSSEEAASEEEVNQPASETVDSANNENAGNDSGSDSENTEDNANADGDTDSKDEEQAKVDFGQTYTFKPFNLNLGNPLENRYLRLEVSLEYLGGRSQKAELDARKPQLRDAVISVASRKTREFLLSPDGKDQLRLELLNQINQHMNKKVERVFISDILIE